MTVSLIRKLSTFKSAYKYLIIIHINYSTGNIRMLNSMTIRGRLLVIDLFVTELLRGMLNCQRIITKTSPQQIQGSLYRVTSTL
jgi:hypothetical protein